MTSRTIGTRPTSCRADDAIRMAESKADELGVEFHADYDEGRIIFSINRHAAAPGSGATVIETLLRNADAFDVPVVLDVKGSIPRLVEYYWRFGFRLIDGDAAAERAELDELARERQKYAERNGGDTDNYGVTTMWRDRYAGPLPASPP